MAESGACDHTGPRELAGMAEDHLRRAGIPPEAWDGCRFGFGEDVISPVFKSIYTEVERRGQHWVCTAIERLKEPLAREKVGLTVIRLGAEAQKWSPS